MKSKSSSLKVLICAHPIKGKPDFKLIPLINLSSLATFIEFNIVLKSTILSDKPRACSNPYTLGGFSIIILFKSRFRIDSFSIGKDIKTISLMEDDLSNKHALGYMIVDILLKLGLTGTVIGFILMLLPIGEIKDFDTQIIQQLLSKMSGGMAVALYTTLTGLITSIFLRLQYFLLDSSLTSLINYLSSKLLHEE